MAMQITFPPFKDLTLKSGESVKVNLGLVRYAVTLPTGTLLQFGGEGGGIEVKEAVKQVFSF